MSLQGYPDALNISLYGDFQDFSLKREKRRGGLGRLSQYMYSKLK